MSKLILAIMTLYISLYSQTEIPAPTEPKSVNWELTGTDIIGDFDRDASNDMLISWSGDDGAKPYCFLGIYSYKKNAYLFTLCEVGYNSLSMGSFKFGDINNDEKVELIYRNKIYEYSSTLSKKKLP
jgi:hypothetical protein